MVKYGNLGSAIFIKILELFLNAVVTYKTTAFISALIRHSFGLPTLALSSSPRAYFMAHYIIVLTFKKLSCLTT